jgi:hypothetical protein
MLITKHIGNAPPLNNQKNEMQENSYGLIYKITNTINHRYYIGKKCLHKGKAWEKYWGSSKELSADIKQHGKDKFNKEVLQYCESSYELSYYEIEYMIKHNWLSADCYNQNMSGRYFKSKLNTNENRTS